MPTRNGAIHLFRFAGINVYLHWSWFVVALYQIQSRSLTYTTWAWPVLEYLALFCLVLVHEFGHALACRQVGGRADQIVLWPLGGVAYVDPPQRPGATLWSIAAGPLVNVAFFPILSVLVLVSRSWGWATTMPDLAHFVFAVWFMNTGLLVFNMLPIYPLDGGQILRSLLWFPLGRGRSLMVAAVLGFGGVALLVLLALWSRSIWTGVIAAFVCLNCWNGLVHARALLRADKAPRWQGIACPTCHVAPPIGLFWTCPRCRTRFDLFGEHGVCPGCGAQFNMTRCLDCGASHSLDDFHTPNPGPAPTGSP